MHNPGHNPFEGNPSPPPVDLRLRNGWIIRRADPSKYRWKPWKKGHEGSFDIVQWKESVNG